MIARRESATRQDNKVTSPVATNTRQVIDEVVLGQAKSPAERGRLGVAIDLNRSNSSRQRAPTPVSPKLTRGSEFVHVVWTLLYHFSEESPHPKGVVCYDLDADFEAALQAKHVPSKAMLTMPDTAKVTYQKRFLRRSMT